MPVAYPVVAAGPSRATAIVSSVLYLAPVTVDPPVPVAPAWAEGAHRQIQIPGREATRNPDVATGHAAAARVHLAATVAP